MTRIADIAAALAGYDPDALDVDGVQAFLAELTGPLAVADTEHVPLFDALGRVLAEAIVSPVSVPPHDNSAMDGFAFDGALLDGSAVEIELRVAGTALAGAAWRAGVGPGEAVKIMTGAVMPAGCDTVIPQELCQRSGTDGALVRFLASAVRRGDNRRLAGEDLMQGQAALHRGDRVTPAALGLIGSLGIGQVPVLRQLRVAYFSTGDELLAVGEPPREGAVYDSNRYTVFGLLSRLGVEVLDLGQLRDDPAALESALAGAGAQADAIITSGGVSAGEADHTREVLGRLGEIAFWRIAMRPGRPMAVGLLPGAQADRRTVLFGLPGNPVAVMVTFLAFVRPALLRMMGCNARSAAPPPLLRATALAPIRKKAGRTEYQRGLVTAVPGDQPQVRVAGNQGSGVLSSMVEANGLVVLPHAQGNVAAGDMVDVMVFEGVI